VVQIDRVSRVVKGGRRFRFRATMVIGDRKGRVGLGIAKGQDVQSAIQKATADAKKHMITVPILDETIPFELTTDFAGAKVLLKPASAGTGIIAGGAVRPIIELAGITNILSKSLGSDNRINNAKATMKNLVEISQFDISPLTKGKAKAAPEKQEEAAA
jgi:small subunit ribosomal protein S5